MFSARTKEESAIGRESTPACERLPHRARNNQGRSDRAHPPMQIHCCLSDSSGYVVISISRQVVIVPVCSLRANFLQQRNMGRLWVRRLTRSLYSRCSASPCGCSDRSWAHTPGSCLKPSGLDEKGLGAHPRILEFVTGWACRIPWALSGTWPDKKSYERRHCTLTNHNPTAKRLHPGKICRPS